MGYYTAHELEIVEGNDFETNYEAEISSDSVYSDCFEESIKWYDHQKEIIAFSKKHPKTLFKLSGEGEENGDMWEEYYKNGLTHRIVGKMVFEEFNIEQLG